MAMLLADLGVTKSHSRPHVSDDNPYSEAQFKTLKYQPDFPARFDSIEHARAFCQGFFAWYNHAHRHSGIGYMMPAAIHTGQAQRLYAARQRHASGAAGSGSGRWKPSPASDCSAGMGESFQHSDALEPLTKCRSQCLIPLDHHTPCGERVHEAEGAYWPLAAVCSAAEEDLSSEPTGGRDAVQLNPLSPTGQHSRSGQ